MNMSYEELVAKRNNIIGFDPDNINECLEAVKQNPYNLQFINKQTPEMCLEAVKQNGFALKYVKEQTPEICLEAVKEDGFALKYVKLQTPEMCLEAVKQYPFTLRFVKEQTPEICLAAVKQNGSALQFVKEQTPEMCLLAVKDDESALNYVKDINMLSQYTNDMKNDVDTTTSDKAIAIVELFERLLDCKEIDIPCSDTVEQSVRYEDGNCARLYGAEYYNLVEDVINILNNQ